MPRTFSRRRSRRGVCPETLETRALLATITVTSVGDTVADDGEVTLREAVQAANTDTSVDGSTAGDGDDVIVFADTTNGESILLTSSIDITESVQIQGNGPDQTILEATARRDGFQVSNSTTDLDLEIEGVRMRRFETAIEVFSRTGSLAVRNSRIRNNRAGINARNSVTVANTEFYRNRGPTMAGINVTGTASIPADLKVSRSRFVGNVLRNSNVFGAGVRVEEATATIDSSIFQDNRALGSRSAGAGLGGIEGDFTIRNSTFTGNSSHGVGAGIAIRGTILVENTTVVDNHTVGPEGVSSGGGVFFGLRSQSTMRNSVVAGNTSADGDFQDDLAVRTDGGFTLVVENTFLGSDRGTTLDANGGVADEDGNLIGSETELLDPMLGPLADNGGPTQTMMPLAGSPLIDAGGFTISDFDQRGMPRQGGPAVDIGAVEQSDIAFVILPGRATVAETDDSLVVDFDVTLQTALDSPLAVRVVSVDGSATAGEDYEAVDTELAFTGAAGETLQFSATVLDDAVFERRETFYLQLETDSGTSIVGFNPASVQIASDERTGVLLEDGVLNAVGDDNDDVIVVASDGTDLTVTFNGNESTFAVEAVTSARFELGDGNNEVDVAPEVDIPLVIRTGGGSDTVTTGAGNDDIETASGDDIVDSGAGDDRVLAGAGADSVAGGEGDDFLNGQAGNDTVAGGGGADRVRGEIGRDSLIGGDGDDTLEGGGSADTVHGGEGNDSLYGFSISASQEIGTDGNDQLFGDAGNDTLIDEIGLANSLRGGVGNDTLNLGQGRGFGGDGDDRLRNFGNAPSGLFLSGGDGDDTLGGGRGNDSLRGGPGADNISGGDGDDTLAGEGGGDRMFGGHGHDLLDGGAAKDRLYGRTGSDTILGGEGNDVLRGEGGDDVLHGQTGNDTMFGGFGNDLLNGAQGDDSARGEQGHDVLLGSVGSDQLFGEGDTDMLIAGSTNLDSSQLEMVLAEWSADREVAVRRQNLIDGTGSVERENGDVFLRRTGDSPTVFDDGEPDTVFGGDGIDWFFLNDADDEKDGDFFED